MLLGMQRSYRPVRRTDGGRSAEGILCELESH